MSKYLFLWLNFSPNLPVDYELMVGSGYPKGNETNIDVLLYSKGSADNMCGAKGKASFW